MTGIIDLHTHYIPQIYREALERHVPGNPDGWPTPRWRPQTTLAFMRSHNISYSVLSLSSPHFNFGNREETETIARVANEEGASLHRDHPNQLGYLASLPLPYADLSMAEIDRALAGGAEGFTVPTNTRGIYWGSPILDPVYAKLNQEHAIVALHPNQPSQLPLNVDIDLPTPLMGFFFDTTMAFMNLLRYHFFDRFPNIRLIVPHGGAFMPILADRDATFVHSEYQADMYDVMKHVYFDTAGAVMPRQLPMLLTLADPTHIVYGSDIPYTDLRMSGQLLSVLRDGGTDKGDKKAERVSELHAHTEFLAHHHATAELPYLMEMLDRMLAGGDVLGDELRQQILTDNAVALLGRTTTN